MASFKRNPFDFVKSVSYDKKDIMVDDIEEKAYQPFLINKALSYHQDSVFLVNEMNIRHGTDNRLQYLFFINTLRKRKRFSKWHKPYESKKLDTVKNAFGISTQRAKEYLELLNDKQYCLTLLQEISENFRYSNKSIEKSLDKIF